MNTTYYNRNFRFVYQSKEIREKRLFKFDRIRHLIGAGQLSKYIGEKNAETVLKKAENMKTDKLSLLFRKCGKIEIYVK